MTDGQSGRHVPAVKFAERHRAAELLKQGGDIPDELRPAVREIVTSAAKRRWGGVVFVTLGAAYLLTSWLSDHGGPVGPVIGIAWLLIGSLQLWEPQRTIAAARRQGLGPDTRYGWPR